MSPWLVAMLALAATAVAPPEARAQGRVEPKCPAGTVKIGEQRKQVGEEIIVQARCRRMTDAELVSEFTRVDALVKGDRAKLDAFRSRFLPQLQGQIEEWEQLAEHARHEVYLAALNATILSVLHHQAARIDAKRVLTQGQLAEVEKVLQENVSNRELPGELRFILRDLRRAEKAGDVMNVAQRIHGLPVQVVAAAKADGNYERILNVAIGALHTATADPTLHFMMASAEMGAALIWQNKVLTVGIERVDQLSAVAASELKAIEAIAKVYKPRVDELAELRRAARSRGIQLPRP